MSPLRVFAAFPLLLFRSWHHPSLRPLWTKKPMRDELVIYVAGHHYWIVYIQWHRHTVCVGCCQEMHTAVNLISELFWPVHKKTAPEAKRKILRTSWLLLRWRRTRLPGCICLRNDLYCVGWGVKLYSLTHSQILVLFSKSQTMPIKWFLLETFRVLLLLYCISVFVACVQLPVPVDWNCLYDVLLL